MTNIILQIANITELVILLTSSMIIMQEAVLALCILDNDPTKKEKLNQVSIYIQENYEKEKNK